MEYTKKVDGSKGLKTTVELCDANERSVRATVFLDADGALAFEVGSVVALRSARVSIWQGVVGLALSVGGVVIAPDVPQAAALRSAAVAIVEQAGANEGGSGALMVASSHSMHAPASSSICTQSPWPSRAANIMGVMLELHESLWFSAFISAPCAIKASKMDTWPLSHAM